MNPKTSRMTLLAGAMAAATMLAACGDSRNDVPRTSSVQAPATSAPATDRATADASAAVNRATDRAANAADKAVDKASDAVTTSKVKARLMAEPGIDSLQIDVDTSDGRVTLSGEVDTPQNRARAKELARSIAGVTGVVDRLTLKSG